MSTRALMAERRRARHRELTGDVVLNCNSHGYGDACVACWLAEGTRNASRRVRIYATERKADFVRMLGQTPLPEPVDGMQSISRTFSSDGRAATFGGPPRLDNWARIWQLELTICRPPLVLGSDDKAFGCQYADDRTVLLCPFSYGRDREWPLANWLELAELLQIEGWRTLFVGDRGVTGHECLRESWSRIAATMLASRLVIGCDSAPCHLAGTLGVHALALLGPTTDAVFAHLESVRCVAVERRVLKCVGCWFGWGRTPYCPDGCAALSHITPEEVLRRVRAIVATP